MTANSRISPNSDLFVKLLTYFKLLKHMCGGAYQWTLLILLRSHSQNDSRENVKTKKDAKNVGVNGAAKYD